jgi:hypothetical protein
MAVMKKAKLIRKLSAKQFEKLAAEFEATANKKRAAELEQILLPYVADADSFDASDKFMIKIGYVKTPDAVISGKKYSGVYELSNATVCKLAALENRKLPPLLKCRPTSKKTEKLRLRMYAELARLFDMDKRRYATACRKLAAFEQKIYKGEIQ